MTTIDILRALFMFTIVSVLLTEIVGYFWHRFVEHAGVFGDTIRGRHIDHHYVDYNISSLRRNEPYKSASSWSWYLLGSVSIVLLFLVLPLQDSIPLSLGIIIYAHIVSDFHGSFHVTGHWLSRYDWYYKLVHLHSIHHWKNCNYGIMFFWMDKLLGTYSATYPDKAEDIFPNYKGEK